MKKFFLLCSLALFAFTAKAQDANEIVANYFEAIGGADKWSDIQSMRMSGSTTNQGMTFPITVLSMRPNLQMVEVELQGKSFVDSYDGEVAWSINPFMGGTEPTKKNEEETEAAAENNLEPELLNWEDKGHTLTYEGEEEVDGTPTYKLKLVKEDGTEEYYFFDTESYALIMQRVFAQFGPMKGQAIDTYMSDYDEVNGLYMPFSMEQKMGGQTFMQMTAETIEINPEDVSKDTFAFPGDGE